MISCRVSLRRTVLTTVLRSHHTPLTVSRSTCIRFNSSSNNNNNNNNSWPDQSSENADKSRENLREDSLFGKKTEEDNVENHQQPPRLEQTWHYEKPEGPDASFLPEQSSYPQPSPLSRPPLYPDLSSHPDLYPRSQVSSTYETTPFQSRQVESSGPPNTESSSKPTQDSRRWKPLLVIFLATAGGMTYYYNRDALEAAVRTTAEPEAKPRKKPVVKKPSLLPPADPDALNFQHDQLAHSWAHPGLYAWGSNVGRVVDPSSPETEDVVRIPRRIRHFDGRVLRDVKLSATHGVAVSETGDVEQWGSAHDGEDPSPRVTLRGKDVAKVETSADRVIALTRGGEVLSFPMSRADQLRGRKVEEKSKPKLSSWLRLWGGPQSQSAEISYRILTPSNLAYSERVSAIASGSDHCVLLTSNGRVFTAASNTTRYPRRGQLGVPGLTWATRPTDRPYDGPHEIPALKGVQIAAVAAGESHSVALGKDHSVWTWGDNTYGQLGGPFSTGREPLAETPMKLRPEDWYANSDATGRVTAIAAGGSSTFFTAEATEEKKPATTTAGSWTRWTSGKQSSDLWACGRGSVGTLGTGKLSHVVTQPVKVAALSGMKEYDERRGEMVLIPLGQLSAGATHAVAVLGNQTRVINGGAGDKEDTNFGNDVLVWGGNEFFQLGTRKRKNLASPGYIAALEASQPHVGDKGEQEVGIEGAGRMQLSPRRGVKLDGGKGRTVKVEQRVVCGEYITGVYSGT